MSSTEYEQWIQANRQYLMAAIHVVRLYLERKLAELANKDWDPTLMETALKTLNELASKLSAPAVLARLCNTFGLTSFERDVLLLCAGMELDEEMAEYCAAIHGDDAMPYPTMQLAAVLPDADWRALSSSATLRYWRLIEISPSPLLVSSPLNIDQNILFALTGTSYADRRLTGIVVPLSEAELLAPSHETLAEQIAQTWSSTAGTPDEPVVQLCGTDLSAKRSVALRVCEQMGLRLSRIAVHNLPTNATELHDLRRIWDREAFLHDRVLLLECDRIDKEDQGRDRAIDDWLEASSSFTFLSTEERRPAAQRPMMTLDVESPTLAEQRKLWHQLLGEMDGDLKPHIDRLVYQFNLSYPTIRGVCAGVKGQLAASTEQTEPSVDFATQLWQSCRVQARPKLDDLVQRIDPAAEWDDLVLPAAQMDQLREIEIQMRHRATVYETWGFNTKGTRGLGISALFAGPSGTGKTMAAEVLARALQLDLYRIDLSMVVNKYIGETEKNLKQVFEAAEAGGAVLLFDEADSLFGKRSDVKSSHDRFANLEVSYLLQRMEDYWGIAILTTNLKDALDTAFQRRLRFIVDFPFPEALLRRLFGQRVFPSARPQEGLIFELLSRLSVAGGAIRNIAMRAAFLAAEVGEGVTMGGVYQAARLEFGKMERSLPASVADGLPGFG